MAPLWPPPASRGPDGRLRAACPVHATAVPGFPDWVFHDRGPPGPGFRHVWPTIMGGSAGLWRMWLLMPARQARRARNHQPNNRRSPGRSSRARSVASTAPLQSGVCGRTRCVSRWWRCGSEPVRGRADRRDLPVRSIRCGQGGCDATTPWPKGVRVPRTPSGGRPRATNPLGPPPIRVLKDDFYQNSAGASRRSHDEVARASRSRYWIGTSP
jgi:hypothetical protein